MVLSRKQMMTSTGVDVGKEKSSFTIEGSVTSIATMGIGVQISQKPKKETTI